MSLKWLPDAIGHQSRAGLSARGHRRLAVGRGDRGTKTSAVRDKGAVCISVGRDGSRSRSGPLTGPVFRTSNGRSPVQAQSLLPRPGATRAEDSDIQTNVLVERWQEDRDADARDELFERYLPLARSCLSLHQSARADGGPGPSGLGRSARRHRPLRPGPGRALPCVCIPTVLGELKRYFRNTGWSAHVPRGAAGDGASGRARHPRDDGHDRAAATRSGNGRVPRGLA